ncbi:hypothetical protein AQUCO_01200254v1 [Aquilegia coerulea]|uniref:Uncharacterized protein n=1 Tax=Aquilegia coerulea TaxID=218851 RepID=A0A2G5E563_AQUCA|nr:hypothetical protein AQUCO_01200254v1 [Aquilegia coerulea]
MKSGLRGTTKPLSLPNPILFNNHPSSLRGALQGCLGSLDGACIEKLLLHCASALESKDITLAQQVMWVLNNVASSQGDPNQRLTSWFLRALISRASMVCPPQTIYVHDTPNTLQSTSTRPKSVTELAEYVDLTPWHRFGFCASNSAILRAIEGYQKVHILDFSITHGMQWPTFIDTLAKRPQGSPILRITVPACRPPVPPFLGVSTQEVGLCLANFALSRNVPFEFHVIHGSSSSMHHDHILTPAFQPELLLNQLNATLLNIKDDEALVVNCQNWLRYLPDEPEGHDQYTISFRDRLLEIIRSLNPCIVVVVDEDADLTTPSLSSRITTSFNYLWIPFDALETFLPKESSQRTEYEADIGHKIENIISYEGLPRIERLETGVKLIQRMNKTQFTSVTFCEDTIKEVKFLLDEHASGWGMKREDDMLVLTWKGHNSVFATAWVPNGFED